MSFNEIDELLDDGIYLPAGGKRYRIPSPDAELGLWCQRVLGAGIAINAGQEPPKLQALPQSLNDDEERELYIRLLGPAWQEMLADGVSWERVRLIGQTVFVWVGGGREMAELYWNSGGDPKVSTNRANRRAGSTGSAGASTTKARASTSGTRSPAKSTSQSASRRSRGKPS
jgi:hypothetical protein